VWVDFSRLQSVFCSGFRLVVSPSLHPSRFCESPFPGPVDVRYRTTLPGLPHPSLPQYLSFPLCVELSFPWFGPSAVAGRLWFSNFQIVSSSLFLPLVSPQFGSFSFPPLPPLRKSSLRPRALYFSLCPRSLPSPSLKGVP